jgi:oligopeptidase B
MAPRRPYVHRRHGIDRPDDYAWMRDRTDPELLSYLAAERGFYDVSVADLAHVREALFAEMAARLPATESSAPWRKGDHLYFTRRRADRQFGEFCRRSVAAEPDEVQVLLDVDEIAGTSSHIKLGVRAVSPDGRLLAYSVDCAGDEVYELRFRDLVSGDDLPDAIAGVYEGGVWAADSATFFYLVPDALWRPYQIKRHTLGDPASVAAGGPSSASGDGDPLVYEEKDERYDVDVEAPRSGEVIVITAASRDTTEVRIVPAAEPTAVARIVEGRRRGVEYFVDHLPGPDGGRLVIVTDDGAPEYRLCAAPVATPGRDHWTELVAENPRERLLSATAFAGCLVLSLRQDSEPLLRILRMSDDVSPDPASAPIDIQPGIPAGSIHLAENEEFGLEYALVAVTSYSEPITWQHVDLVSGARTEIKRAEVVGYNSGDYRSERRFVPAPDGVQIPVTLVRHRGTPLDGSAPCYMYGYGAYEAVDEPEFDAALPSLLDRGIVFAHAHIRGGGEMGRRWWRQGRLRSKATTFSDHIAVADALAGNGAAAVVDGSRIVTRGISAGGLLQGAVFNARPDRWAGVVAEVPFVDVISSMSDPTMPLTVNEWDEWGDPADPEDFAAMLAYSPYDNLPAGAWPPLLVTGALHDTRVLVHEPAKWTAKLRAADPAARLLFRAELGEGAHAGPAGRYDRLRYEAEIYAWILAQLSAPYA